MNAIQSHMMQVLNDRVAREGFGFLQDPQVQLAMQQYGISFTPQHAVPDIQSGISNILLRNNHAIM